MAFLSSQFGDVDEGIVIQLNTGFVEEAGSVYALLGDLLFHLLPCVLHKFVLFLDICQGFLSVG
jgi:hypothetical protein